MKRLPLTSIYLLLLLLLLTLNGIVSAHEVSEDVIPEYKIIYEEYVFPTIKPYISVSSGYSIVDVKGSGAAEYEYLHNSVVLGSEMRIFSFPHRLHIDLDFKNEKDYFGEFRYAYKDIVYFRGINRTLFHNLENIRLQGSPIEQNDIGERYGVRSGINSFLLRFKTPDFPAHLYIDGRLIEKKGDIQQRFLGGSGWWNNMVRTSQKRDIDWQTKSITVGANSHLGPIEIDLSHNEKRFDVGGDRVFTNNYEAASVRQEGEFPHNLIPNLKGSSTTLKVHTSYTGGLVASGTLSKIDIDNTVSGAKANYFIGHGEIQWMPVNRISFFLKYRHKEADIDNPDTIPANYLGYASYTSPILVKPSISSITDTISGTLRYRPVKDLTLRAEYSYDDIKRKNSDRWHLPDSTEKHTISLSADARIMRNMTMKARYIHRETNNPALNIEPDRSDEGRLSVSWIPVSKINALLSYSIAREKRDKITCAEGCTGEDAENRSVKRDKLLGSVTFAVLSNLSLTTSYAYIHNRIDQDIVYEIGLNYGTDRSVPYKDTANNYAMDINYMPGENINLNAGISHTTGKGFFSPSNPDLSSTSKFSKLNIRETVFRGNAEYRFKKDITVSACYKYADFKDSIDNIYDSIKDGVAHTVLFMITKRWR